MVNPAAGEVASLFLPYFVGAIYRQVGDVRKLNRTI